MIPLNGYPAAIATLLYVVGIVMPSARICKSTGILICYIIVPIAAAGGL